MPAGRPSDYCDEVVDRICLLLSEGQSLNKICKEESMPDKSTVFKWLARHSEFADKYARAKEQGSVVMAEEILEIADDSRNDFMESLDEEESRSYRLNGENIQRARLRIDSRKWLLSKLQPKKYGDKLDLSSTDGSMTPQGPTIIERQIIK